jgi:flagellar protein FliO/FliZ
MVFAGVGSIVALIGVVALIPLALWLVKRSPLGAAFGGAAQGPMRVVATLALTPAQRLVTVEVGAGDERRWLVLAVGAQGVQTVHTMAPGEDASAAMQAGAAVVPTGGAARGTAPRTARAGMPPAQAIVAGVGSSFARLLAAQRNLVR